VPSAARPGATAPQPPDANTAEDSDDDSGVLVVSREIVAGCPTLQALRARADEFDPDLVWLLVLESVAECMTNGGLQTRAIAISGDDEHRQIVRDVLGSRGVDPQRVTATPEARRRADVCRVKHCPPDARVEIRLVPPQ
jgi:hypothetical protein